VGELWFIARFRAGGGEVVVDSLALAISQGGSRASFRRAIVERVASRVVSNAPADAVQDSLARRQMRARASRGLAWPVIFADLGPCTIAACQCWNKFASVYDIGMLGDSYFLHDGARTW
jgi:hypothetical protein